MIRAQRLHDRIEKLAECSKVTAGAGVTRLAFSKEYTNSIILVKSWMEQSGMQVHLDPAGNLIGRKEGIDNSLKPIVIGSHIDSVSNGGKYDGIVGIVGGIEVVQHISEENIAIQRPIEVIAFGEEEASRFGSAFFGSKAMTGTLEKEELDKKDKEGITRKEAMIACGLNPEQIFTQGIRYKGEQRLYLEMHIEQGPVLEQSGIPVGIVTGMPGVSISEVTITGQANHIGGTPMDMRNDALLGASEIALATEEECLSYGSSAVGAVGLLNVFPGETNVIPGLAVMSIDVRDLDSERLEGIFENIKSRSLAIANKRGLTIQFKEVRTGPALCSQQVIYIMKEKSEEMNLDYLVMPSGGGHDAQLMALLSEIGMIFIRSTGGSHNPAEYATVEDITLGTELLLKTALHYLNN